MICWFKVHTKRHIIAVVPFSGFIGSLDKTITRALLRPFLLHAYTDVLLSLTWSFIYLVQQPATLLSRDHHASKLLEKKLIRKNLQKNFALN